MKTKRFLSLALTLALVFGLSVIPLTVTAEDDAGQFYGDTLLDEYIEENYHGKITVTIAASRPVENSRIAVDAKSLDAGHTFIRLDSGGGDVIVKGFSGAYKMSHTEFINNATIEGALADEAGHEWNAAVVYEITLEQANRVKAYIDGFDIAHFNVVSDNCTKFAVGALIAAGIEPPTREHVWTLPPRDEVLKGIPSFIPNKEMLADVLLNIAYYGYTPADAVQDFKAAPNCVLKYDGALHKP